MAIRTQPYDLNLEYNNTFSRTPLLNESDLEKAPSISTLIKDSSAFLERKIELKNQAELIQREVESYSSKSLRVFLHKSMQEVHKQAKQNDFLESLISGNMNCSKAYVVYLCNLFWLHKELEASQERIIQRYGTEVFVFPFLYRSQMILSDIKIWSFLNPTASKFSDKEVYSSEFLKNVEYFVQPCVIRFVAHLKDLTNEDPKLAIGSMYALYGTIMSGGQLVKAGVKKAFLERLETKIQEHMEGDVEIDDDENSKLKDEIIQKVLENPLDKERFAEESVSMFSFNLPGYEIPAFKKKWHDALDQVPEVLRLDDEARRVFENRISLECQNSIRIVLDSIDSLRENMLKEII